MKRHSVILGFSIFALLLFYIHSSASDFQAEISPCEINPGDAFIIKITGAKTVQQPLASFNENQYYFSNCGEGCLIAIAVADITTKPGTSAVRLNIGEEKRTLMLIVKPLRFPTQVLTLPEDKVFLSRSNLRRAAREDEILKTIFQKVSEKLWEGNFIVPLGNDISTTFGTKRILNKKKMSIHRGVDIKGQLGEEVRASNYGRVVFADNLFFGGNTVILDHGQGIYTIYMHLSKLNVKPHDIISKGYVIGFVGSSGRSNAPHLHFGAKIVNINANPISLMKLDLQ